SCSSNSISVKAKRLLLFCLIVWERFFVLYFGESPPSSLFSSFHGFAEKLLCFGRCLWFPSAVPRWEFHEPSSICLVASSRSPRRIGGRPSICSAQDGGARCRRSDGPTERCPASFLRILGVATRSRTLF